MTSSTLPAASGRFGNGARSSASTTPEEPSSSTIVAAHSACDLRIASESSMAPILPPQLRNSQRHVIPFPKGGFMDTIIASRRLFLGGLAAAGAASLLPRRLWSQAPARRIDVHQHFVSPSYYQMLTARNSPTSPVPGFAAWKDYSPAR